MYEIDLLKGKEKPIGSKPAEAALLAILVIIPLIVIGFMLMQYQCDSMVAMNISKSVENLQVKIDSMQKYVDYCNELDDKTRHNLVYIDEIREIIRQQHQFSPIMVRLVERMPSSLLVKGVEVNSKRVDNYIDDPNRKGKKIKQKTTKRTLNLSVTGDDTQTLDKQLHEYIKTIKNDRFLMDNITNVELYSQKEIAKKGNESKTYELLCYINTK